MTRRFAHRAATGLSFTFGVIAAGWLLLWLNSDLPGSIAILCTGISGAVTVTGIAVMLATAERPEAEDPDEYLRPLRTGSGRTVNRLTVDMARHGFLFPLTARTLAARKEAAAREKGGRRTGAASPVPVPQPPGVPGREGQGAHSPALWTPAGDLSAARRARHRRPPSRWRRLGGYWRAPVTAGPALLAAVVPDSPARETPAPGSEPSGVTGQGLATRDLPPRPGEPWPCCGSVAMAHEDWCLQAAHERLANTGDWAPYEPTPAEDAYMAENHPTAMLTVEAPDAPEQSRTPANTCEHGWPGSDCGSAHPCIVEPTSVAHEQCTEGEHVELPSAGDDPAPLFADDTAWQDFAALKDLLARTEAS